MKNNQTETFKHGIAKPMLAAVNPFIANTAKDYDMSYKSVEMYYNIYGNTSKLYEKLEEYIKQRSTDRIKTEK